jgi:hypothetical protein
MTVVNSKDFITNQKRYFNLATNEDIFIRRGKKKFRLAYTDMDNADIPKQPILEPDDDLQRAISMEELRTSVHEHIHKLFANK